MASQPYRFSCTLTHLGKEYQADGTIGNGSITTTIVATSERWTRGARRVTKTSPFAIPVTDTNVGKAVQQQLAKHLGRQAKQVKVAWVKLVLATGPGAYDFSGHLKRGNAHYMVIGKISGHSIVFTLHPFKPHPNGGGGGEYGRELLAETLPFPKFTGDLKQGVQNLVHRRIARHLRCGLRMVEPSRFSLRENTPPTRNTGIKHQAKKRRPFGR